MGRNRMVPLRAAVPKSSQALNSSKGRLLLEMLCHSLPFGVLVLDAQSRLVFANTEATHTLSLWRRIDSSRLAHKKRYEEDLPSDLISACDRLRREFVNRNIASASSRANFASRIRIRHPKRPFLSAVVSLERSRRDRAVAGFCILLQDALTSSIAAGRGDQLALLTPAERHVAKMVANGLRNEEVAGALGKSVGTVKAQLRSIFAKLEVQTRTQLVALLRSLEQSLQTVHRTQ